MFTNKLLYTVFFQDASIKHKLNKKQLLASVAMERSPIKVPSENDETPVKDEALDFDEDTLQGKIKLQRQLLYFHKVCFFSCV